MVLSIKSYSPLNITVMREELKLLADTQLVDRFKVNQNEAFDEIIRRHWQHIFNYVFKMLNYLQFDAAQDLTQDIFIKAMQAIREGKYTDNYKFIHWVIRIARNTVIDYERKRKIQRVLETTYYKDLFGRFDDLLDTNHERRLMDKETEKEVLTFLKQLSTEQREVLIFHFFGDYKYKDIVKILNEGQTSINTYLGRSRYGLRNLKKILEQSNYVRA